MYILTRNHLHLEIIYSRKVTFPNCKQFRIKPVFKKQNHLSSWPGLNASVIKCFTGNPQDSYPSVQSSPGIMEYSPSCSIRRHYLQANMIHILVKQNQLKLPASIVFFPILAFLLFLDCSLVPFPVLNGSGIKLHLLHFFKILLNNLNSKESLGEEI